MGLEPTYAEQQALAVTRKRTAAPMSARERTAMTVLGLAFAAGAGGLLLYAPPRHVALLREICAVLILALASRVQFETPFGFSSVSQLAFVPLAFVSPPSLLPIAALVAIGLAAVPDVVAGKIAPARLGNVAANASFALGPAWVFALAIHHDRSPIVLAAALLAQFLIDGLAFTSGVVMARGARIRESLGDGSGYLVDAALSLVGLLIAEQASRSLLALFAVIPLLALFTLFARERTERLDGLIELGETYRGTALLLGDVVEADDSYTGLHSQGVVELALAVGDVLGLDPDRRRNLEFGALLHDVGKIAIPKSIINKPDRLTQEEFAIVKTHAAEGQRMLTRIGGFMSEVGTIVRSHHERWDGCGYPDGLRGDAIPLEARIITCCDSWSAMRTDRPYRAAMDHESATAEISRHVGGQFDPDVAAALLSLVPHPEDRRVAVLS